MGVAWRHLGVDGSHVPVPRMRAKVWKRRSAVICCLADVRGRHGDLLKLHARVRMRHVGVWEKKTGAGTVILGVGMLTLGVLGIEVGPGGEVGGGGSDVGGVAHVGDLVWSLTTRSC